MDTHDSSPPPDDRDPVDSPEPAPPPGTLPRANPLPIRQDGWTVERQARFLNILAATRSVTKSARAVRMGRESAHRLRQRDPHGLFAAMWALCFAIPPSARDLMEVDQRHRLAMARGAIPLAIRLPVTRATKSTS